MSERLARRRKQMVVALCVFIAALAAVYILVGDTTIWGEWLSVAPPIVWGVLLLPSAVRLRSWVLLAFIVSFLVLASEWPQTRTTAAPAVPTVRVVTWNIGAGNVGWAEPVKELQPDIVLVQESTKPALIDDGSRWYGTIDPGTLSRFPTEVLPTERVGPWTEPQLLLMEIHGRNILVANVRLMLPSVVIQLVDPLNEKPIENYRSRVGQYEKLASLLRSTATQRRVDGVILGGDFNIPAKMPSLKPLRSFLRDAWSDAGSGWGPTVPEFLPLSRVDQIWLSPEIRPISVRTAKIERSDHRAVVADLTFLEAR